jgi:hypothetical protein
VSESVDLLLPEQVLLLALRDRDGGLMRGTLSRQALAGAVLAELTLAGRVMMRRPGGAVTVRDDAPMDDPLLDDCLGMIAETRRSARTWFLRFSVAGDLRHRVAEGLVRRGILRTEKRILGRRYPEVAREPELRVHDRLYAAVFDDEDYPSPRTIVLLSIAHSTGLFEKIFGELDADRRLRVEILVEDEVTHALTKELVTAMKVIQVLAAAARR